jgi:hypothetical protein
MKIFNWSKILHVFGHILRPQSGFYLMPLKYLILNNDRISLNILICLRCRGLFKKKKKLNSKNYLFFYQIQLNSLILKLFNLII